MKDSVQELKKFLFKLIDKSLVSQDYMKGRRHMVPESGPRDRQDWLTSTLFVSINLSFSMISCSVGLMTLIYILHNKNTIFKEKAPDVNYFTTAQKQRR